MKKFKFRLDTLMRVRAAREERARIEYAEAVKAWMAAMEHLRVLRREEEECRRLMREELEEAFRPERIASLEGFLACAALRISSQREKVEEAREAMESKREELVEASRELKVVEKLHDKAKDRHNREMLHEEQKLMDEIAGSRFIRGRAVRGKRGAA